jgi:hypothetical protein
LGNLSPGGTENRENAPKWQSRALWGEKCEINGLPASSLPSPLYCLLFPLKRSFSAHSSACPSSWNTPLPVPSLPCKQLPLFVLRQALTMLLSNSWTLAILLPHPPKELGLHMSTTTPSSKCLFLKPSLSMAFWSLP